MTVIRQMKAEIVAVILALVFLLFVSIANADDDRRGGDDVTVNANTELLNQIGGSTNKSLALSGGSLGDVDIYGCQGSTQFSVFVLFARQTLRLDPLCVAEKYDAVGKHVLAAQLRCTVPEIAALDYGAMGTTCEAANEFYVEPPPAPMLAAVSDPNECCDDEAKEQIQRTADELDALKAGLERERIARQAYARQAQAAQKAEADYAQTVLDKLKTIDQEGSQ